MEGFPTVAKALRQLAMKAINGLGQLIFYAFYYLGDLEIKIFNTTMWALDQIVNEVALVEEVVATIV